MHTLFIDFFLSCPFHAPLAAFAALSAVHHRTYILLTPLYTINFASHARSDQGGGEHFLLSSVHRCEAMYIGESSESSQNRAKNPQAITKGAQKWGREDLIVGGRNFKGLRS